jgi:hypothetical protein
MELLVRNKVRDFPAWYAYFVADASAAAEYGLTLARIWQSAEDPNEVFFLLEVEDIDRANAFMARPESQALGVKSGVFEGEFYFLTPVPTKS